MELLTMFSPDSLIRPFLILVLMIKLKRINFCFMFFK